MNDCILFAVDFFLAEVLAHFDFLATRSQSRAKYDILALTPISHSKPGSFVGHVKHVSNTIRQKPSFLASLRACLFKILSSILRRIYNDWIVLSCFQCHPRSIREDKLELAYRFVLRSFLGLPKNTPRSVVYATSLLPSSEPQLLFPRSFLRCCSYASTKLALDPSSDCR
jgi:hypothetical protein